MKNKTILIIATSKNKIHILFLDECTNATPTIQGYAFNLVLDKELDGKWKLPDNVRVVAAGNEVSESLSANKMSEPLFRRFAHVYIKTTVKDWLLWASKNKIHPAIYAFVASHGMDDEKNHVLRTKYDGENCTDPRRWEKASDQMKFTNNPYSLTGIIGKELTEEFVKFTQKKVITLYDVLNDNYNLEMPKIPADIALNTLVGLASVDEENVKKVRDFVKKLTELIPGARVRLQDESLTSVVAEERLKQRKSLKDSSPPPQTSDSD